MKKAFDIKSVLIYLVMAILILFIALPPITRIVFKEESETPVQEVPHMTALICKRQVATETSQYDISSNTTYQDDFERLTLTYQVSPLGSTDIEETPSEETPDTTEEAPLEEPQVEGEVVEPEQEDTTPLTQASEASIQEEVEKIKGIEGVEVEEEDNLTRLILSKDIAPTLEESSPYLKFFQDLDNQRKFFEDKGYSCEVIRN